MGRHTYLEVFDLGTTSETDQTAEEGQGWQAGFEAGYELARQEICSEQSQLSEQILQSLRDQAFGYHEARAHILDTLRPLFGQLAEVFMPSLAAEMLVPLTVERLHRLAEESVDEPVLLRVPANLEATFMDIARNVPSIPLNVLADESIGDLQVILDSKGTETLLDLQTVLEEVRGILAVMTTPKEKSNNG